MASAWLHIMVWFVWIMVVLSQTDNQGQENPAYSCERGACHATSHTFHERINKSEISFETNEILEYHFHVYFFQDDIAQINAAKYVQSQLISKVKNHEFLVVLNGIDNTILPDLNNSLVPDFNMKPVKY